MENACSNIFMSPTETFPASVNPADIILFVLALIVLIVLIWCIWAFFYAIFLFIFSKGDDAKVKSAWNWIRYMIIGLFLTVMLLFLWPTLFKLFRMDNAEIYSAKNIFAKIWNIVSCLSTGVTSVITDYPNNNPFGSTASVWMFSSSATESDLVIYEL